MRESTIEKYLIEKVKGLGGLTFKFTSPGCAGVPDRLVLYKGITAFVELKAPGKKLRMLQEEMGRQIERHGAYFVICSSTNSVDRFIQGLENIAI